MKVTLNQKQGRLLRAYYRQGISWLISSALLLILLLISSFILLLWFPLDQDIFNMALTILYFPIGLVLFHRLKLAKLRLNLVPISPQQLPEVYEIVVEVCQQAGLKKIPSVYLSNDLEVDPCVQTPGLRKSIVISSDFLAGCRENQTPEALRFMVAHQVGHFVFNHHRNYWLIFSATGFATPGFGMAMAKNLEYSADAWAAQQIPAGAFRALTLCAVGKDNFPYLNPAEDFSEKLYSPGIFGFIARWTTVRVPVRNRLRALKKVGLLDVSQETAPERNAF
ncbi:hypothetical protein NXS08_04710 [Gleimia sp. 6138-11-ORH1]|uniref:hypothetical protein n=1 Tax=Gleimia sp. 6138-11-ORH1 TaxID=2973937 RepID=UPI002167074B|nr:hypothetical protein [Gleimia sp. 6138-11-ORH1]MCS4484778.1 hypothetical protein [Gleimia sp. 6138-11-ORH1]